MHVPNTRYDRRPEALYCLCALLLGVTVALQVAIACGLDVRPLSAWSLLGAVVAYALAYRLEVA